MPRIRCRYMDCVFVDDGYCSAAAVEFDPDTGCATYKPSEETASEAGWDDEDKLEEWTESEFDEEEDDLWIDEEEDEF
jgi:hypothetical protein